MSLDSAGFGDSNRAWKSKSGKVFYTLPLFVIPKFGVPKGIRTPVAGVKGQCPGPLDDGDAFLAGPLGVEPRLAESESAVLPVERQPNNFLLKTDRGIDPPGLCRSASRSFPCCRTTCLNAIHILVNKQTQFIYGRGQVFFRRLMLRPAVV